MVRWLWSVYDEVTDYLQDNGFYNQLLNDLQIQRKVLAHTDTPAPTRALCLGLGTFSNAKDDGYASSAQLFTFRCLIEAFDIPASSVIIHDPAFTDEDRTFIRSFGYSTPDNPAEAVADLVCNEPTLVLMTYLPYSIIEFFMSHNWSKDLLKNVIVVSPELNGWLNHPRWQKGMYMTKGAQYYIPRIQRCIPLFTTIPLEACMNIQKQNTEAEQEDEPAKYIKDDHDGLESILGNGGKAKVEETANAIGPHAWRIAHSLGFHFQWIPPYRLHALGQEFWPIIPLSDKTWSYADEEDDEYVMVPANEKVKVKL